jgi:hypothetical protein
LYFSWAYFKNGERKKLKREDWEQILQVNNSTFETQVIKNLRNVDPKKHNIV